MISPNEKQIKSKIDEIGKTSDSLTGRAGLTLMVRYIESIKIYQIIERYFGKIRMNRKGLPIGELFKQLFCFFMDGTSFYMSRFDELLKDSGYAGAIETPMSKMSSSHQMKRFFRAVSYTRVYLFRHLLQKLFIWRLNIEKPDVIILNIDTMVMDNDDAKKRQGVEPTYKKVKGFQPLQMTWGRYVVDAVFRGGSKHSNHGVTVVKMVEHVVKRIRKEYSDSVAIVLRMDAGFLDEVNFEAFERLSIGYICGGRVYQDIRDFAENSPKEAWKSITKGKQDWEILPFGDRRATWDRFRRVLLTRPKYEDNQQMFSFARPETIWYTNLGMGQKIDDALKAAGKSIFLTDEKIVELIHGRGADELVHRAIKDFGTEQLPFERFVSNAAFYYIMLVAFNLYEAFKEDITADIIPLVCYATTFRRRLIDIAGKIVRTGRRIILRVSEAVWESLRIKELWESVNALPVPTIL